MTECRYAKVNVPEDFMEDNEVEVRCVIHGIHIEIHVRDWPLADGDPVCAEARRKWPYEPFWKTGE